MEITDNYNGNIVWDPENLNGLINKIHYILEYSGEISPENEVVRLFNTVFKIGKDRSSGVMNANVIERDGEKGLKFLKQEFKEWVAEEYHNPGEAWKEYPERWRSALNVFQMMDYSYHERINHREQIAMVVGTLIDQPMTRQAYLSIYHPTIDAPRIGSGMMIPCILGYQFTQVDKDLNMTVMARSIDANNCLMNDIWLADRLLDYVVAEINYKVAYKADRKVNAGSITFMISNLHSYPEIVRKEMTR